MTRFCRHAALIFFPSLFHLFSSLIPFLFLSVVVTDMVSMHPLAWRWSDYTLMCVFRYSWIHEDVYTLATHQQTHYEFLSFFLSVFVIDETSKHRSSKEGEESLWNCIVRFCTTISAFTRGYQKQRALGLNAKRKGREGEERFLEVSSSCSGGRPLFEARKPCFKRSHKRLVCTAPIS